MIRLSPHTFRAPVAAIAITYATACCGLAGVARAAHEPTATTTTPSRICSASSLEYGAAPVNGTIGSAGEVDCRRFAAAAGARVRVRAVATSGSIAPHVRIESADCPSGSAPEVTCRLTAERQYLVTVRDAGGSGTGGYALSLQRLDDPVGCSAHEFGVLTRSGAITSGETECWRFTAAQGDKVRLRLVTAAAALTSRAEVLRPDGTTRCAPVAAGDSTCVLDASGTHTILVRDAAAGTGGYSVSIQRLGGPVGCSEKTFGPAGVAGTIATTGEADCWRFAGGAGHRVRVRVVETAGALDPVVEVLRPTGTTRCAPARASELNCLLDATGVHTILVRDHAGPSQGGYRIGLQRLDDPVGCSSFAYGTAVSTGTLGSTGETDCWRFAGGPDRILVRVVATSGGWVPIVEVVGPSGTTDCQPGYGDTYSCRLGGAASQPRALLVRDTPGTRSGGYRISIQRLNGPVGCAGEPGSEGADGSTSVAQVQCHQLGGEAGDLVWIRVIDGASGSNPDTDVVGPDGNVVCRTRDAIGVTCELKADGPHAILVRSAAGAAHGGYRVSAVGLNDHPSSCPMLSSSPSAHTAHVLHDAEVDCYTTWSSSAGARELRVEATSGTLEPVVEVLRPDGTVRCHHNEPEGWFDCFGDQYEYQRVLVYDATGTGHGSYEIDRR